MTDQAYPENVAVPPSLAPITALKISVIYAAAGAFWILFSDRVVDSLAFDIPTLTRLQAAKGWLFVAVTATLLYLLVYRAVASVESSRRELIRQKVRTEEASRAAHVALWEWDLRTGERNWTDVVDSLLGYEPGAFRGPTGRRGSMDWRPISGSWRPTPGRRPSSSAVIPKRSG